MIELIEDANYASKLNHLDEILVVDENKSFSRKIVISGNNNDLYYINKSLYNKKDIDVFLKDLRISPINELGKFKIYKYIDLNDTSVLSLTNEMDKKDLYSYISKIYNAIIKEGEEFITIKGNSLFECIIKDIEINENGKVCIFGDIPNKSEASIYLNSNSEVEGFYAKIFD